LGKKGLEYGLAALTGGTSLWATKGLSLLEGLKKSKNALKLAKAAKTGTGMFLGRAAAHQATTGKWGKALKTPGQEDKIEAGGKYGYGEKEAATLSEALIEERKSKEDEGTLAADIIGAGATQFAGSKFSDLFGGKTDALSELTGEELEASSFVPGSEGAMETLEGVGRELVSEGGETLSEGVIESFVEASGEGATQSLTIDDLMERYARAEARNDYVEMDRAESLLNLYDKHEDIGFQYGYEPGVSGQQFLDDQKGFRLGGQVPNQQDQLIALLSLAQMQQQGAEGEARKPSIAEYFSQQGKTLGGNNTQSLSQMLGR